MTDDTQQQTEPVTEPPITESVPPVVATPDVSSGSASQAQAVEARPRSNSGRPFRGGPRGGRGGGPGGRGPGGRGPGGRGRRDGDVPAEADYEEKNVEVARVTRVTKGGKRMRFRVLTVIGNRKGRVGFGLAKGVDVALATGKATTQARKALLTIPLVSETIPHAVDAKFGAAHVLLKPAPKGTGIKAGGSVRIVLELAGVPNIVSKILGSSNKVNNVKATFQALKKLRLPITKTE
ncbi:30S ribosomal protein S5 [Candidatus Uhrbacteria bacterium]|nr:30S ribosomal protein S5 [Candidatus Uhrbacteria bacterium]